MKSKDAKRVIDTISNEGMWYVFTTYSDFKTIEDKEFHLKRKKFIQAGFSLLSYLHDEENK